MKKIKINKDQDNWWTWMNTPDDDIPHIKKWWVRLLLIPFMLLWFFIQLWLCSVVMGSFAVIFGLMGILSIPFQKKEDRDYFGFGLIVLPFIAPFVWLYKYFALGEYNLLIK